MKLYVKLSFTTRETRGELSWACQLCKSTIYLLCIIRLTVLSKKEKNSNTTVFCLYKVNGEWFPINELIGMHSELPECFYNIIVTKDRAINLADIKSSHVLSLEPLSLFYIEINSRRGLIGLNSGCSLISCITIKII